MLCCTAITTYSTINGYQCFKLQFTNGCKWKYYPFKNLNFPNTTFFCPFGLKIILCTTLFSRAKVLYIECMHKNYYLQVLLQYKEVCNLRNAFIFYIRTPRLIFKSRAILSTTLVEENIANH